MRNYHHIDHLCMQIDQGLRTLWGVPQGSARINPSDILDNNPVLSDAEKKLAARLMRVNHSGEVAAQALYQGQSLTCKNQVIKETLRQAAIEENDHLLWCESRLKALDSHTSYLNPLWYTGSLAIGMMCGLIGDSVNLGFLAETERLVVKHLDQHLVLLPEQDTHSRAILTVMRMDELKHATTAHDAGAMEFASPVSWLMQATSKVMTTTAYYV